MNRDDKNLNNGGNGFFNKNPILIFAIFAVIMIIAFRGLSGGLDGNLMEQAGSKNVTYSDLKEMIKNKQVGQVGISEFSIRAVSNGEPKTIYIAKRVSDPTLVPLLDEQKIPYSAYSEAN